MSPSKAYTVKVWFKSVLYYLSLTVFIEFLLNHVAFSTTAHVGPNLYKHIMAVLYRYSSI